MSYDLSISVKAEGCGKFMEIAEPEYDSPTYNLGAMFRACTGWDFSQSEYYKCSDVIMKIERGIRELRFNTNQYVQYEAKNGWNIRESEYYDKTLEDMPFFCSSEESLETIIKKAILNEVLPVIEGTKMITEEGENHDN